MDTKKHVCSIADAVRGCWLGKNIGGTLGAPFEGCRELQDVTFYVQKDLQGRPEPNDDLDLQLAWLTLAEYYGPYPPNKISNICTPYLIETFGFELSFN